MKIYYHLTAKQNLNSIMEYGLIPQVGFLSKLVSETLPAIYLLQGIGYQIEPRLELHIYEAQINLEYAVDSYSPFYLSDYDQQILCLTLEERSKVLADEAEITIKKTDNGYHVIGISLIYEDNTDFPTVEEKDAIFDTIVSQGLIEGYVEYQTEKIKLFDNLDVELSETTVRVPLSDNDDECFFSVDMALRKDIDDLFLTNEKGVINILLDGEVIFEGPASKSFYTDRPNYLHFNFESYKMMEYIQAISKTFPLKYVLSEIK